LAAGLIQREAAVIFGMGAIPAVLATESQHHNDSAVLAIDAGPVQFG